jgi:hypothetical protein
MTSRSFQRWSAVVIVVLLVLAHSPLVSRADEAVVLPKGLSQLKVDANFYFDFDKRWDKDGNLVPYAAALNRNLNLGPGGLSFGRSSGTLNRDLTEMFIQGAYGLTDRLSVGFILPYFWMKNNLDISVDGSPTTGGASLGFTAAGAPCPLIAPGCNQSTVANINALLGQQFGLKPIQTWQDEGIGDLIVGGRYQWYRTENFRSAFTGGARFPTGKVDDPDNAVDTSFGIGAYALLFQLQNDFMQQAPGLGKILGFPNPGEYFVNFTLRYEWRLPSKETLRVCPTGGVLCPASFKDNVNKKAGDVIEVELAPKIGLFVPGLNFVPLFKFGYKFEDHYSGSRNLNYGALSDELDNLRTSYEEYIYILSLQYTTMPLYLEKRFPVPLAVNVSYRDRFAGTGGVPNSQYVSFTLQVFY